MAYTAHFPEPLPERPTIRLVDTDFGGPNCFVLECIPCGKTWNVFRHRNGSLPGDWDRCPACTKRTDHQ